MSLVRTALSRDAYPDCTIEWQLHEATDMKGGDGISAKSTDDSNELVAIRGHRGVLSKAPYFAALFARAEPTRIDRTDQEGARRAFFLVYRVDLPFRRDSLNFLVDLLYGARAQSFVSRCSDTIDAIGAATYLGLNCDLVEKIVGTVTSAVLKQTKCDTPHAGRPLDAMALHLIAGDLPRKTKCALLARVFGLLSEPARQQVPADLIPLDYYRPNSAGVGGVEFTDDGVCWRRITLACDQYHSDWSAAVIHQGLTFSARASCGRYFDESETTVSILVAPEGETLGPWPRSEPEPNGAVMIAPRAMSFRVKAYHPIAGTSADHSAWWSQATEGTTDARQDRAYAADGRALPPDTVLVPCGFSKRARRGDVVVACRQPLNVTIEGRLDDDARLSACVIEIRLEEPAPRGD